MAEDSPVLPRWGDLPIVPDTESGIAAIEREQITKPRPMDLDGPQLYQPSNTDYPPTYDLSSEEIFTDKLVINSLKLVQHVKKLRQTLQTVQQQQESQKMGESDSGITYPPLPTMPIGLEDILSQQEKKFKPPEEIKEEKIKVCPELDEGCVQIISKKAVAIICAHVGFEITTESVLNILLDVLHDFFLKITHLLRVAVDKENLTGNHVFPDVLEQVFHEIGLGSVRKIQAFYKERVINYHNHVLQQCQNLIAEYEKLTHPEQSLNDSKAVKYKEENIAQIHFPVNEEMEEMEHGEAVIHLEELHTLQNIEHEPATTLADDESTKWIPHHSQKCDQGMPTETPTLDSDDDIMKVSDSPEDHHDMQELIQPHTSISVSDIISSSPLGSNKKIKKK